MFHRKGKPIKSFRRAWRTACTAAGQPDRIPHDFRRTGHKTRSVFERYNIVSETDLQDAAKRLAAAAGR